MSPTSIVGYLTLFAAVGFLFIFAALLLGRFLRAKVPTRQKGATYECGEPAVGSSFVQFDLRFYVVALLFIIFEVEVAFFFPWATVFGKATQLADLHRRIDAASNAGGSRADLYGTQEHRAALVEAAARKDEELGLARPPQSSRAAAGSLSSHAAARRLALAAMLDIGIFFGVLLVGFAYVWNRGDLDWVRAASRPPARSAPFPEESSATQAA